MPFIFVFENIVCIISLNKVSVLLNFIVCTSNTVKVGKPNNCSYVNITVETNGIISPVKCDESKETATTRKKGTD